MILSHNQKNKDMKEGDLILVSAEATGLGKPMEAIIDKIETFMGQTLVTVTCTQPLHSETVLLIQIHQFRSNF